MRVLVASLMIALSGEMARSGPADILPAIAQAAYHEPRYYWRATHVGETVELLTLFCRACSLEASADHDMPLVSVLRDTLGDLDPKNDRVLDVWLLTSSRPSLEQHLLSAVPFFHWRAGEGSQNVNIAPLINASPSARPALSKLGLDILQWAVLDRVEGVRASSRTYHRNELNYDRLQLEGAINYLRSASDVTDDVALTRNQLDIVLGRLELRKHLLGGLANEERAARLGEEIGLDRERIRTRNWELLRQCAEKTGLIFESLNVAGTAGQYGMLWFPLKQSLGASGSALDPIWKLLNIKDPRKDQRLQQRNGATFDRVLDENGTLLPVGAAGLQKVALVPLGVYSLNYPKVPFLIIDFRDTAHVPRREVLQRSISEIASGVLLVSRFTGWYYFAGAQIYDFIEGRYGSPVDQAARLDCHSRFRLELASDRELDPMLRKEIQHNLDSLRINPLESSPANEMRTASANYAALQIQAEEHGVLVQRVERMRRAEIASFSETTKRRIADGLLGTASFGLYEPGPKPDADKVALLDRYRRFRYELNFLDSVVKAGTPPEVSFGSSRLYASVAELSSLITQVPSSNVHKRATSTLQRLNSLSQDAKLQEDCSSAVASLKHAAEPLGKAPASPPTIGGGVSSMTLTFK